MTNPTIDNLVRTSMNGPSFTLEDEEWLCQAIGDWYYHWKDKMVTCECKHKTHMLGIAKEQLKSIVCGDVEGIRNSAAMEEIVK